jgi:catechol 2,3-dioxygenase-like lactoylglutathione lyase family enzyme
MKSYQEVDMLKDKNPITTIGVKNMNVAKDFYEKRLGLTPMPNGSEEVQLYRCGNGLVEVYKSEFAGTNQATSLTWTVGDDIDKEVKSLSDKGVEFEHYEMPDTKIEGDVHVMKDMKAAWFKDPDGNILCMHDH